LIRNLLLSGGPGHDFDQTSAALAKILASAGETASANAKQRPQEVAANQVVTEVVTDPEQFFELVRSSSEGQIEPWDLITVNALRWQMRQDRYAKERSEWAYTIRENDLQLLADFVAKGGGILAVHTAVICFDAHPLWQQLLGASWNFSTSSHPPVGEFEVTVTPQGPAHPLTAAASNFFITDELYGFLDQEPELIPLLSARYLGREQPLLWAQSLGQGRVVTDLLGHSLESLSNATHKSLLVRAAQWAARSSERLHVDSVGSS
jgi:type 1 glutamine amidotransferase